MAQRLIGLEELDDLEGLVEQHRQLKDRLEALERQAAQFDTVDPGVHELERRVRALRQEVVTTLESLLERARA